MTAAQMHNVLWTLMLVVSGIIIYMIFRVDTSSFQDFPDNGQEAQRNTVEPIPILNLWRLAWQNLWQKRVRAALLLTGTALTGALLFGAYFFLQSMEEGLEAGAGRLGADLMVVPQGFSSELEELLVAGTVSSFYMDSAIVDQVRRLPGVAAVSPQLYLKTYQGDCCGIWGDYPVIGFEPETDFTITPWLINVKELGDNGIIVGHKAGGYNPYWEANILAMADRIKLLGEQFYVKGVMYPTGTGTDYSIFITLTAAQALAGQHAGIVASSRDISALMIKAEAGTALAQLKTQIEALEQVEVIVTNQLVAGLRERMRPLQLLVKVGAGLFVVIVLLQGGVIFSGLLEQRQREFGFFRAMGATAKMVAKVVLAELGFLSLIGGGVGVAITAVVLYDYRMGLQELFQLPLVFPTFGQTVLLVMGSILATYLVLALAAAIPLYQLCKKDPYEAIREGE
jgi:putative ABC transport system permease protein